MNGNANDESGNGNDGIVNGATPINDRFGNASGSFLFENDNYITIPPISLYDIQDNSPFKYLYGLTQATLTVEEI